MWHLLDVVVCLATKTTSHDVCNLRVDGSYSLLIKVNCYRSNFPSAINEIKYVQV
jgi:hypothetical protein